LRVPTLVTSRCGQKRHHCWTRAGVFGIETAIESIPQAAPCAHLASSGEVSNGAGQLLVVTSEADPISPTGLQGKQLSG
jgi:hypothetical protein